MNTIPGNSQGVLLIVNLSVHVIVAQVVLKSQNFFSVYLGIPIP